MTNYFREGAALMMTSDLIKSYGCNKHSSKTGSFLNFSVVCVCVCFLLLFDALIFHISICHVACCFTNSIAMHIFANETDTSEEPSAFRLVSFESA